MPIRRPKGPSKEQIRRRRLVALVAIVGAIVIAIVAIVVAFPHVHHTAKKVVTTAVVAPRPFRIVFPEGFTRSQMSVRVRDVGRIPRRKSHKPVALSQSVY